MNKIALRGMIASALLMAGNSLAAGPTAEIKVVGELISPTCEVKLPFGGVFDYGSISHTQISKDQPVSLGLSNTGEMEIKCDAETSLTFNVIDNRQGTASVTGAQHFGLGNVNGTGKLGYYKVAVYLPRVDYGDSRLFITSNSAITSTSPKVDLEPGKRTGWAPASGNTLAIGKNFSAMMYVEAFLAKSGDMHGGIGEGTNLDGSTTLDFAFGL